MPQNLVNDYPKKLTDVINLPNLNSLVQNINITYNIVQ